MFRCFVQSTAVSSAELTKWKDATRAAESRLRMALEELELLRLGGSQDSLEMQRLREQLVRRESQLTVRPVAFASLPAPAPRRVDAARRCSPTGRANPTVVRG